MSCRQKVGDDVIELGIEIAVDLAVAGEDAAPAGSD